MKFRKIYPLALCLFGEKLRNPTNFKQPFATLAKSCLSQLKITFFFVNSLL